jgi:MYXO-CTERM domain-containing protein
LAATVVRSTGDGWAGWGVSAVMLALVAGLERRRRRRWRHLVYVGCQLYTC